MSRQHKHKCRHRNTKHASTPPAIWEHSSDSFGAKDPHTCPVCGTGVYVQYNGKDKPNTRTVTSCETIKNPIMNDGIDEGAILFAKLLLGMPRW